MSYFTPDVISFDVTITVAEVEAAAVQTGGFSLPSHRRRRRRVSESHLLNIQVRRPISESVVTQSTIRRPICESVYVDASVRRPVRESMTLTGNVYEKTFLHNAFHDLRDLLLLRQLDKLTE